MATDPKGLPSEPAALQQMLLRTLAQLDATQAALLDQERAGIDVVTDGEQSRQHFVHGFLERVAGIDFSHKIEMGIRNNRYKAMVPTVTGELRLTGRVHANFSSGAVLPLVKEGKVKGLAVMLDQRSSLAPDIPTAAEAGIPPASITSFVGLFGPAQLPKPIIDRISALIDAYLKQPETAERMRTLGAIPVGGPAERLAEHLKSEQARYRDVISRTSIKPQ